MQKLSIGIVGYLQFFQKYHDFLEIFITIVEHPRHTLRVRV